jgi:FtsP/CotA-like multicopper oxidase with cupredoxin domain
MSRRPTFPVWRIAWAGVAAAACADWSLAPPPVALLACPAVSAPAAGPRTRVYYVAAEDVNWDFAPLGSDPVFNRPLPAPWGQRRVYRKQHYVQYTNNTFTTPVTPPAWQGILGPVLHAAVGDTMKVVFCNRTETALSIHPHGVRYDAEDEGAVYDPPRGGGDSVPAGGVYTYTWRAIAESGPLPGEPSSKVWLYHSHVVPDEEVYRGLIGTIVVTDSARARADGTPNDVDRELTTLWMVFNENMPTTPEDSAEGNLKHAINGYLFGNLSGLTMNRGERVRWYLVDLGTEVDWHTPHWHGATLTVEGRAYNDVIELGPATMRVADMIADNPGTWLLHCHVADHMMAGMYTTYTVAP